VFLISFSVCLCTPLVHLVVYVYSLCIYLAICISFDFIEVFKYVFHYFYHHSFELIIFLFPSLSFSSFVVWLLTLRCHFALLFSYIVCFYLDVLFSHFGIQEGLEHLSGINDSYYNKAPPHQS
jgi:hypothetical protein